MSSERLAEIRALLDAYNAEMSRTHTVRFPTSDDFCQESLAGQFRTEAATIVGDLLAHIDRQERKLARYRAVVLDDGTPEEE